MHVCNNYSFSGSDSIYDLKQDLLSLTKEKYSTMLTVKKKIEELKFESKKLERTVSPMEKQGILPTVICFFTMASKFHMELLNRD